jgi:hypothetical protein
VAILPAYWSYIVVRKPEYLEKTTDLSQVTDEVYNITLYWIHLAMSYMHMKDMILITDTYPRCAIDHPPITEPHIETPWKCLYLN